MKKNLLKRMIDYDLKHKEIANYLNISLKTLYNKINGVSEFSIAEAFLIKKKFFPNDDIEVLFEDFDNSDIESNKDVICLMPTENQNLLNSIAK